MAEHQSGKDNNEKYTPTMKDLCPHSTPDELIEADAVIEQYLVQTLRQYNRICQESDEGDPRAIKVQQLFRSLTEARKRLPEREFKVFEVITNFQYDHDRWPSVRELMKFLGYKSPRSAAKWIRLFRDKEVGAKKGKPPRV